MVGDAGECCGEMMATENSGTRSTAAVVAVVLLATLVLSACAGAPRRDTFDLAGAAGARALARPLRSTLAVAEPQAIQPIDSDRIVVRTGPNELAHLAEAQWVDRLPRLVQSRLIAGFDVGRSTGSVVRAGEAADHILATEIRRFEIDVANGQAMVEIAAKILDPRGVSTGRGRVFSAQAPAQHSTGVAATQALEEALSDTLRQIVRWTATQV
jgi:cholesterol transport system auxiliary component